MQGALGHLRAPVGARPAGGSSQAGAGSLGLTLGWARPPSRWVEVWPEQPLASGCHPLGSRGEGQGQRPHGRLAPGSTGGHVRGVAGLHEDALAVGPRGLESVAGSLLLAHGPLTWVCCPRGWEVVWPRHSPSLVRQSPSVPQSPLWACEGNLSDVQLDLLCPCHTLRGLTQPLVAPVWPNPTVPQTAAPWPPPAFHLQVSLSHQNPGAETTPCAVPGRVHF